MPLEPILAKLVSDAEAACPNAVKRELEHGLTLNLRKLAADELETIPAKERLAQEMYFLTLWRYKVYPSIKEWNTVTQYLGYTCPIINPERHEAAGKFCLRGFIPARPPEPMGMEFMSDWMFSNKRTT